MSGSVTFKNEKKLIDALKQGPKTWTELEKVLPKKTLARWLKRYTEVGIIVQDPETKQYDLFKRVEEQRSEKYIKHALWLISRIKPEELLPYIKSPYEFIFHYIIPLRMELHEMREEEIEAFLSHLRTGHTKLYELYQQAKDMIGAVREEQEKAINSLRSSDEYLTLKEIEKKIEIGRIASPKLEEMFKWEEERNKLESMKNEYEKTLKQMSDKMTPLLHRYNQIRQQVMLEISKLKLKVEYNPSALKGKCYICE